VSTQPIDDWLETFEEARASSSAAGERYFALPEAREPTPEEQQEASLVQIQEAARERWRNAQRAHRARQAPLFH
jgi:hypothetical protein